MYNTLKEIQKALPVEGLNKLANKVIGKKAEEIVDILKKENIDISIDAANECVEYLKGINIVEAEELDNVTGGCGTPNPKYYKGQQLRKRVSGTARYLHLTILSVGSYDSNQESYLYDCKYEEFDENRQEYLDQNTDIEIGW